MGGVVLKNGEIVAFCQVCGRVLHTEEEVFRFKVPGLRRATRTRFAEKDQIADIPYAITDRLVVYMGTMCSTHGGHPAYQRIIEDRARIWASWKA